MAEFTKDELAQAIADALKRSGVVGGASNNQQSSSSSSSNINFSGASKDFESATSGVGKFLGQAGMGVRDFTTSLIGVIPIAKNFKGTFGDMIGYLTNTQATFQALSKVGGGFNGDLGALRAAAASTRMPLDKFASLVGNNSSAMAGLGGSVNDGAKRFSQLSRAMFEDGNIIGGMQNLGYNLEEANEMLLDNATLTRRSNMLNGRSDTEVAQATLAMAKNIAVMSEITGESAKDQKNKLADAARDGKNIAATRALEKRGITDASDTMAQALQGATALGPAAQAYLSDLNQLDVALTPLTRHFTSLNPVTAGYLEQINRLRKTDMDSAEKKKRIDDLLVKATAESTTEYVNSTNLFAATTGQINAIGNSQAELIGQTENFRVGMEAKRLELEGVLGRRVTTEEATIATLAQIRGRVGGQTGGTGDGQEISTALNKATLALAESAAGINDEIAKQLSANTTLQTGISTALNGLGSVADAIGAGGILAVRKLTPKEGANPTLLEENNFKEVFAPLISSEGLLVQIKGFRELAEKMGMSKLDLDNLFNPPPPPPPAVPGQSAPGQPPPPNGPNKALGGGVTAGRAYKVNEDTPKSEMFIPGMDGAIVPQLKSVMNRLPKVLSSLQADMSQLGVPMSQSAQSAMATMGGDDIGTLIQHAQITNELLSNLLGVNTTQARTGEKHLRSVRGAGNLMNGIGRA
jgi:hypothetical protein